MSEPRPERRLLDASRHTRTMQWIMAIMLFLTVLAGALALGTMAAAQSLDRQLVGRLTVQVVEADAGRRDADAARLMAMLRADPAVAAATRVPEADLARLLKPWLGAIGDDPDLPMPALIDVDLRESGDGAVAAIAGRVQAAVPASRVDRHERWMTPVSRFMDLLIGIGGGLVLLMAMATGAVVVLAARAGLESHRETIEVMHMLGSTDVQVARLFQRRTARDTAIGGAIGTVAALAVVGFLGAQMARLGSALLGGATLGIGGWIALALLPLLFVALATLAARLAVLRALGERL